MNNQLICALLPEISLASCSLILLLLETIKSKLNNTNYYLTLLGLVVTLITLWLNYGVYDFNTQALIFDNARYIIKTVVCLLTLLVLLCVRPMLQKLDLLNAESMFLYLLASLGLLLLISANNFLVLYVAIELFSLPVCVLIALQRTNSAAIEAAYKYLLLTAIASMFLLYGISLLYGLTGEIGFTFAPPITTENATFKISMLLILIGMIFKFGLVPFHFWIPDVYKGASLPVATFIAVVPKIALLFVLQQILSNCFRELLLDWQLPLLYLAIISLGLGNLLAFLQDDWRRLLGYSAIANLGFLMLGITTASAAGYDAAMFYMFTYSLIYLAIFTGIGLLTNNVGELVKIQDLAGLATTAPGFATLIFLNFLALLGLPPFASFFAKFLVLSALIQQGFLGVALLAVILSLLGVLYCYKIVKIMFFNKTVYLGEVQVLSKTSTIFLVFNLIAICCLGFWVEYFKIY